MGEDVLTRKAVRHLVLRRRNERVAELRDDRMPRRMTMHPDTLTELLVDSDPVERWTLDFEGLTFMGVPIVTDEQLVVGVVAVDWPAVQEADGG